jgi:diguanylate cyclase (GGDEF)-like protein/PAS domain S-box-containing protein
MSLQVNRAIVPAQHDPQDGAPVAPAHPRTIGWLGTTALAMGGSNQSLFLIGGAAGLIATQGSAAVPLLILGLLLSWLALPGWIELILMWPKRVGGIAATCAEAFRPISPVLSNLTGVCYWWGWVPTCGLTAFLSAKAINAWFLPMVPAKLMASAIVLFFLTINLCGIRWVVRFAVPIATLSAVLAFLSGLIPILTGNVDWQQATDFRLHTPFAGWFGGLTSAMAGLYLIGFAAPAFEQAACHVGETIDPVRNVPRAMYASAIMATLYFLVLPVIWLGVLGPGQLTGELQDVLGPTFAPLFGVAAHAAAIWFMMFNMFHGSLAPLAGAARTLAQLSEDGLLPRMFGQRNRNDAPVVATGLTAIMAILFLLTDDPPWVIAAANLCYLIGICLPSVAVWILRRNAPEIARPYRATHWGIRLGVLAAVAWGISALFGFQQYGLPAVIFGITLAYAGAALYAWRLWEDRRGTTLTTLAQSLHAKLTGAMIAVLTLDGAGYLLAVDRVDPAQLELRTVLADIFVGVALLTITVGLVLPGTITHAAEELSRAAQQLATGTMADFSRAMQALAAGDLDAAHARVNTQPVVVHSRDEIGAMATSFNALQKEIVRSVGGLDGAREGLRVARNALTATNSQLSREVTERTVALHNVEQAQEQLRESEERFRALAQNASDIVIVLDFAGIITYGSPSIARMLGHRAADLLGTEFFALCHPDDLAGMRRFHEQGRLLAGLAPTTEVRLKHRDGSWRQVEALYSNLLHESSVRGIVLNCRDITERKAIEEELQHQAFHDPLTGLPNRALFLDRLDHALDRARRQHEGIAVLFLDLDRFKTVNDSLGHHVGDELLVAVAARLRQCLRPGDTLARLGGDEFTVLLEQVSEVSDAAHLAERLTTTLQRPFMLGRHEVFVATSIGIVLSTRERDAPADLLRDADVALYRAKARGGGHYEVFDPTMNARALERLELEGDLRYALARAELVLYFQPKVALATGQLEGMEALLRWQHPGRGMVSPADFIPLAEETGMIRPIGRWVLVEACRQARIWQDRYPWCSPLVMSVNLAAPEFQQPQLVQDIARVLAETKLPPQQLQLEITESVIMVDAPSTMATLRQLKDLGVRLAIDDFGTGYSSLSYLKRFPVDTLKIDKSFIDKLGADAEDTAIVQAVLNLAHTLGLQATAEGVETFEQATQLRMLGCELAQGYYFGRPLASDAVESFLARGPQLYAVEHATV